MKKKDIAVSQLTTIFPIAKIFSLTLCQDNKVITIIGRTLLVNSRIKFKCMLNLHLIIYLQS